MVKLLIRLDQNYEKYIVEEGGKIILYVLLSKALYGTLRAALLFWRRLTDQLKSWGFILNRYDQCVANKMIDGKQCTILWHVDDLKISHVDPQVVTNIINDIKKEFGKEDPLTVNRGKVHEYLGMILDYSKPKKVMIIMKDYIEEMLSELPANMDGISCTPASNHLFDIDSNFEFPIFVFQNIIR